MPGPLNPRNEAWRRFYEAHPEVVASWGEQNGRQPNCGCPLCVSHGLPSREDLEARGVETRGK